MDTERYKRVRELFDAAICLAAEQRAAFLDQECGDDDGLRRDVESLIQQDERPASSIAEHVRDAAIEAGDARSDHDRVERTGEPDDLDPTQPPTSPPKTGGGEIGPYRLLEKIGEGGMGEVWLAEQTRPLRRRVALKLVKHGMDSRRVIARFEAERQALALMDHPAVARVFDAGATPQGRPYFVMEHVRGVPITEHCDRQQLTTRERLELFMLVCDGVQHAHRKAIIHRDLKPSNVLVSIDNDQAAPKIIDFGLAKALSHKLTEQTVYTELGMLIGTPEYMSPEQAELTGQDVDTRTDVYSLGVMLYELITGVLPFESKELREGGIDGIRRTIREEEPSRPSTRLSTLGDEDSSETARRRKTDPGSLRTELRGDLDWITMKALEKDRTRRYGSPGELAADISRHLRDEPVKASPPSVTYQAQKFARRHKVGVGVAAAAVVVLIAFAATMTVQAGRIARERDRANREAEASRRVSAFLADMLRTVDPQRLGISLMDDLRHRVADGHRSRGASEEEIEAALVEFHTTTQAVNGTDAALRVLDEEILARAAATIDEELGDDPVIAAELQDTIARTYMSLGLFQQAERMYVRTIENRRTSLGPEHPETLRSMHGLVSAYHRLEKRAEARELIAEVYGILRRTVGDDHPQTVLARGMMGELGLDPELGELTAPMAEMYDRLERLREQYGDDHIQTLNMRMVIANVLSQRGRHDESVALHLETLADKRRVLGPDHRATLFSAGNLAVTYSIGGELDKAVALSRETLAGMRRVLGAEHPNTLWVGYGLACKLCKQGKHEEALAVLREVIDHGFQQSYFLDEQDLAPLRGDPEFEAMIAEVERRIAARNAQ